MNDNESGEIPLERKIYTQAEVDAMSDEEINDNLLVITRYHKSFNEDLNLIKSIMSTDFEFDMHNSVEKQIKIVEANFCIFAYVKLVRLTSKF